MKETKRVGIPYIHDLDVDQVKTLIIDTYDEDRHQLDFTRLTYSLKIDGFGFRIGKTEDGIPFVETSRSGLIFDVGSFENYTRLKTDDPDRILRASRYDELFSYLLKSDIFSYIPNGTKVVLECLCRSMGMDDPFNKDHVIFVKHSYPKDKLAVIANFFIIDILDSDGNRHCDHIEIMRNLVMRDDGDQKSFGTHYLRFSYPYKTYSKRCQSLKVDVPVDWTYEKITDNRYALLMVDRIHSKLTNSIALCNNRWFSLDVEAIIAIHPKFKFKFKLER